MHAVRGEPIIRETPEAAMHHPETTASLPVTILGKLARLGRFMVFLCSAGWLFPHASTEGMDLTQIQKDRTANKL
jgi:hypothetical protein